MNNPDKVVFWKTWINNHFALRASPLSTVVLKFKTNIIVKFNENTKQLDKGAEFKLTINYRECQSGEYFDKK